MALLQCFCILSRRMYGASILGARVRFRIPYRERYRYWIPIPRPIPIPSTEYWIPKSNLGTEYRFRFRIQYRAPDRPTWYSVSVSCSVSVFSTGNRIRYSVAVLVSVGHNTELLCVCLIICRKCIYSYAGCVFGERGIWHTRNPYTVHKVVSTTTEVYTLDHGCL